MNAATAHSPASRDERRIALIKPAAAAEDQAAHAMKLLDSVLWVFKGTTQSNWIICAAEAAQVIVVHQNEPSARIAQWRNEGKLIVVIKTDAVSTPISPYTLTYPFPTVQVLSILEQLDAELDSGTTSGRAGSGAAASNNADGRSDSHGSDVWAFVDAVRTLRMVNNADAWFVGKASGRSVVWMRGDASRYCCDSTTARAIRTGTRNLSGLTLQKAAAAPVELNPGSGSELAWFAGYHASAAVLAPWLSEREVYRLARWPDLGRVQADDPRLRAAQIRVVASLDAEPATVAELTARTNVSPEVVVRTVNALASCELLERAPTVAVNLANTKPASPVPAGRLKQLIQSLRRHLGLSTGA